MPSVNHDPAFERQVTNELLVQKLMSLEGDQQEKGSDTPKDMDARIAELMARATKYITPPKRWQVVPLRSLKELQRLLLETQAFVDSVKDTHLHRVAWDIHADVYPTLSNHPNAENRRMVLRTDLRGCFMGHREFLGSPTQEPHNTFLYSLVAGVLRMGEVSKALREKVGEKP